MWNGQWDVAYSVVRKAFRWAIQQLPLQCFALQIGIELETLRFGRNENLIDGVVLHGKGSLRLNGLL